MTASVHCYIYVVCVSSLLKTVLLSLQATHFFVGIRGSVTLFSELGNTTHFQNELKETFIQIMHGGISR